MVRQGIAVQPIASQNTTAHTRTSRRRTVQLITWPRCSSGLTAEEHRICAAVKRLPEVPST